MVISSLVYFLVVWLVTVVGRSVGHGFLDLGLLVKFQQWDQTKRLFGSCVPGSKLPLFPYSRGWSSTQ